MSIRILDGPVGTLLIERGIPCPEPAWSAHAVEHSPQAVRAAHHDYAAAGACIHTAATFRTRIEAVGPRWPALTNTAIQLAREGAGPDALVAGSIAPVADCYRPDLSPPDATDRHHRLAMQLKTAGADLILVETFPHIDEAIGALDAARSTGLPVWVSFTAGPNADLLTPHAIRRGAEAAVERGAAAVLVNCIPATETLRFIRALRGIDVQFGAYANAGSPSDRIGWSADANGPQMYADLAEQWVDSGATIVGGCCGTRPDHIAELYRRFGTTSDQTTS